MKRWVAAVAFAAALAACAPTMKAVQSGPVVSEAKFTVAVTQAWTRVPANMNYATEGSVLTRHGLSLDRVHLATVQPGKSLIKAPRSAAPPLFRAGMAEPELVEFMTASMTRLGYKEVAAEGVRPHPFGSAQGIRMNLTGRYASGLRFRGDVALAEAGGALQVIAFVAPAQHYYDASASEVDAMIRSAALK